MSVTNSFDLCHFCILFLQSTPVGSLQTGHEVVVSPNRDKHTPANKVKKSFFKRLITCSLFQS